MALFAKTVDNIASVIANSTALTPRVPFWSSLKLRFAPSLVEKVLGFPNLNPRWSQEPGFSFGKLFSKAVSLVHRECDVPACGMLSLMWGTGFPALYSHENLHPVTHRRGGDLYGATSLNYYRHVSRMIRAGNRPVKYDFDEPRHKSLPDDYLTYAHEVTSPILLTTGENNHVFADSNPVPLQDAAEARLHAARAARLPRLRPPGPVHGQGRRARRLPDDARVDRPPLAGERRRAEEGPEGRGLRSWPSPSSRPRC